MNAIDLKLPQLLAVAYEVGGMEAVVKLTGSLGGKHLHIPKPDTLPERNILVQVAGREVALALCREAPGVQVEFPRGNDTVKLYLAAGLIAEGKSNNQIADALDVTWRQARRYRKKLKGKGALARALADRLAPNRNGNRQIDLEDYLKSTPAPAKPKR